MPAVRTFRQWSDMHIEEVVVAEDDIHWVFSCEKCGTTYPVVTGDEALRSLGDHQCRR